MQNFREHLLKDDEKRFFEDEGYLVVPNALPPPILERVTAAVDRLTSDRPNDAHNQADILWRDPAFTNMIDLPTVLPKVWGLLGGWNIWVNHTHFNVNPPDARTGSFVYGWHRDGGAMHSDLPGPAPLVSIKIGFYLTDLRGPDSGFTYIIPKSHRAAADDPRVAKVLERTGPFPVTSLPGDAVAQRVAPGTAVLYHNRTVHSIRSPNHTPHTRKVVFIQYAFRWMNPVDAMSVEQLRDRVDDPIQRQLLGITEKREFTHPYAQGRSGRYYPADQDVPLKKCVEELGEQLRGAVWQ